MKLSELISQLQAIQAQEGDLLCYFFNDEYQHCELVNRVHPITLERAAHDEVAYLANFHDSQAQTFRGLLLSDQRD